MSAAIRVLATLLVLVQPLSAQAFGLRARSSSTTTYCCYYPVPVVWVAAYPVYYCVIPVAAAPAPPRNYATPTPAPPLAAPPAAPAPGQPAMPPAVGEQRTSYYDAYAVAVREGQAGDARHCSVGFWNSTDRDLVIQVGGQSRTLPRGRGLTVIVPRDFTWQIDGRQPQAEQARESAMEIVIRK